MWRRCGTGVTPRAGASASLSGSFASLSGSSAPPFSISISAKVAAQRDGRAAARTTPRAAAASPSASAAPAPLGDVTNLRRSCSARRRHQLSGPVRVISRVLASAVAETQRGGGGGIGFRLSGSGRTGSGGQRAAHATKATIVWSRRFPPHAARTSGPLCSRPLPPATTPPQIPFACVPCDRPRRIKCWTRFSLPAVLI